MKNLREALLAFLVGLVVFTLVGWCDTAHAQAVPPALPASTTACERAMFALAQSARCTGVPASGAQCTQISSETEVMLRECSGLQTEVVSCMNDVALGRRRITGASHDIATALSRCTQVPAVASVPRPVVALTRCPSGQHLNTARTACLCDSGQHTVYTRRGGVTGLHVCVPGTTIPGDPNFSRYEQRLSRLEQQVADLARVVTELERRHQFMCPPNSADNGCRDLPAQLQQIRDLIGIGSVDQVGGLITDLLRRMSEAEANFRRICLPQEGETLAAACERTGLSIRTGGQNTARAWHFDIGAAGFMVARTGSNQPFTMGAFAHLGITALRPDWNVGVQAFARFGGDDFGLNVGGTYMAGAGVQLLIPLMARSTGRNFSMLTFSVGVEGYGFFVAGADMRNSQGNAYRGLLLGGSAGLALRPADWVSFTLGLGVGYDRNAVLVGRNLQTNNGVGFMPQLGVTFTF